MGKTKHVKWAIMSILIFMLTNSGLIIVKDTQGSTVTRLGKTIIVDQSGFGDYTKIQDAINNSNDGDIVFVKTGVYHEVITIVKEIKIEGESRNDTIIFGNGKDNGIQILSNNVSVNNVSIKYSYNNIYIDSFTNIKISENTLTLSDYGLGSYSIFVNEDSTNVTILNNYISDYNIGISTSGNNHIIKGNYLYNGYDTGIFIQSRGTSVSHNYIDRLSYVSSVGIHFYTKDVNIENNTLKNISNWGFWSSSVYTLKYCRFENIKVAIYGNMDCSIINCEFINISSYIMYFHGVKLYFTNNTIMNCDNYGMYFYLSQPKINDCQIINCSFINNNIGILIQISENIIVRDSYFSFNNKIGIEIYNSQDCIILNNTFRENKIGVESRSTTNNKIYKNRFIDNAKQASADGSDSWYVNYVSGGNYWSDHVSTDIKQGSGQSDPGSDGICDTPYNINGTQVRDLYPLFLDEVSPIANAGDNKVINTGDFASFDGTGSSDDQMVTRWVWEFVYDGQERLIEQKKFDYMFDIPGVYNITLIVYDYAGNSDSTMIKVTVIDMEPPVALTPGDLTVNQGDTITLDASESTDNWMIDSYQWTFIYDGMEQVLEGVNPSFTFNIPGVYEITLEVRDCEMNKGETTFNVTVIDTENPIAVAGSDKTINNGETVSLDATGSSDNGVIESYEWIFDYDGEMKTLTGDISSFNFFIPGTYVINLTVTDHDGNNGTDTLVVIVKDTVNPEPKVTGSYEVLPGSAFDLSATSSTDNHMISKYLWTFYDPALQEIDGPFFQHMFSRSGEHTIDLRVWDPAGNTANITIEVYVLDTSNPVADAGPDIKVAVNTKVDLDGSGSIDDGEIVRYEWRITDDSGFRVVLEGMTTEYTFENTGIYTVLLTVMDSSENVGSDTKVVEVVNTGTLTGKVLDKSGDPIAGATITVTDSNGNKHTATSGSDGSFSIDVPAGSVIWEISADGYDKATGSALITVMESSEIENSKSTLSESKGSFPIFIIIIVLVIVVMILLVIGLIIFFISKSKSKEGSESKSDEQLTDDFIEEKTDQAIQEPFTRQEDFQSDFSLEQSPDEPVLQDQEAVFGDYNLPRESYNQSIDEPMVIGSGEEDTEIIDESVPDLISVENEIV